MKSCKTCGKDFSPYKSTDKWCSSQCYWKDPTKKVYKPKHRSEPPHRSKIKKLSKARDGFVCQLRYLLPGGLQHDRHNVMVSSHHILYLSEGGPDSLWNLVSLCEACHTIVHSDKKTWQPYLLEVVNGKNWLQSILQQDGQDGVPKSTRERYSKKLKALWNNGIM